MRTWWERFYFTRRPLDEQAMEDALMAIDMSKHEAPLFRCGWRVTCEMGHHVCTVARDIFASESQNPGADWTDWQQPMPETGSPCPQRCSRCGSVWMVNVNMIHGEKIEIREGLSMYISSSPFHIHFEFLGWQPPLPEGLPPP